MGSVSVYDALLDGRIAPKRPKQEGTVVSGHAPQCLFGCTGEGTFT